MRSQETKIAFKYAAIAAKINIDLISRWRFSIETTMWRVEIHEMFQRKKKIIKPQKRVKKRATNEKIDIEERRMK